MKAPNITPGPWKSIVPPSSTLDWRHIQNEEGGTLAAMPMGGGVFTDAHQAVATAKAIASLPDLLKALEKAAQLQMFPARQRLTAMWAIRDAAKDVLTKAGYTFP